MKFYFLLFALFLVLFSCEKEVKIDIPGFEQQLVVNGYIETGGFPIVILSKSQNLYAETSLQAYIESFVNDATVEVSNGNNAVQLQLMQIADLPDESKKRLAEMLKVELAELVFFPIQVYSTVDVAIVGEVGKNYELTIQYQGKSYQSTTSLVTPIALNAVYWKEDADYPGFGRCVALLSDPSGVDNSYKWEAKRINTLSASEPWDVIFRSSGSPYFNDEFWDGLTFEFDTRYPYHDTTQIEELQRHYKLGDTVIIKMSSVDRNVFDFFDKKESQQLANGNPFASPVNIPTNISGGCLGVWAGISPWYDTLICH